MLRRLSFKDTKFVPCSGNFTLLLSRNYIKPINTSFRMSLTFSHLETANFALELFPKLDKPNELDNRLELAVAIIQKLYYYYL